MEAIFQSPAKLKEEAIIGHTRQFGKEVSGRGRTIKARGRYRILLQSSAEVLKVMIEAASRFRIREVVASGGEQRLPMPDAGEMDFHSSRTTVLANPADVIGKKSGEPKPVPERPCYLITRSGSHCVSINDIKLALCTMDRSDVNALANPAAREIFINVDSAVIRKILSKEKEVQKALLLEEISHELAHLLGYGLEHHDMAFFRMQRFLRYLAMQAL